jgi:tetratricopeptide (TPR) repeat protein
MSRFGNLEFTEQSGDRSEHRRPTPDAAGCLEEANAAVSVGDFEAALRAYARLLEYDPQSIEAWAGQVRMLIELGEFKEAALWADKALERFPRQAELLAAKGVSLARLGDLQAAMAFSDAAVEEQGDGPYIWLARGDVLLAWKEQRADYCFTRALAAAPGQWLWPWLVSRVHFYYQKFALALKWVKEALAMDASQSALWVQLGRCQLALGMASAARTSFEQARELNPRCGDVAAALVEVQRLGAWARWRGYCRRWFQGEE